MFDKSGKLKTAVKTTTIPTSTLAEKLAQEIAEREADLKREHAEFLARQK